MPRSAAVARAQYNDPQHEPGPARAPRRHTLRIILLVVGLVAAAGAGLLGYCWPFSQQRVAKALEEAFDGEVSFDKFRYIYFPHPGCVAEGLKLVRADSAPGSPPFAVLRRLTLHAAYTDLILRPGYFSKIVLEGLQIQIAPRSQRRRLEQGGQSSSNIRIGEVVTQNAVLEFARENDKPALRFEIQMLKLDSVSRKTPMDYEVAFHNPLPPGEVQSQGHFGPWNDNAPGRTPVSGTSQLDNADLSVFHGISGMLSSHDNFRGVLDHIEAHGKVDIPDFHVTRGVHRVHLRSDYDALVNAFNGDVELPRVETWVVQTEIVASGTIAAHAGYHGKVTSLDFAVRRGRVQDVLLLITSEPVPVFNGVTQFRAHVEIPPEGRPFLKDVKLVGDFVIADGRFTKPATRKEITDLSDRSRGKKPPANIEAALNEDIQTQVTGHVVLRNGTATLPQLSFGVPGALAQMRGTYNLLNGQINFHGTLKTDASFSQTAGGVKSLFLKPLDTVFKRKPRGATMPVKLDGTYSNPQPGLDLGGGTDNPKNKQKSQGAKND